MTYFFIAFFTLVVMGVVLLLPAMQAALPVLLALFPLAILNIVAGWVIYTHIQSHRSGAA